METKTVYQLNPDNSYAGTIILSSKSGDIDPLETKKAGHTVWQIPGNCVEVEPPEIPDGKILFWREGAWVLEDIPPEPKPEPEPEPTRQEIIIQEIQSIDNQLNEIDRLSIRPLRAIMKGVGTDADINRLHELEDKAAELRIRRAALVEELNQLTEGA